MDLRLKKVLQRDDNEWRLSHACPACTYKLNNEIDLKYGLLFTMDGNNSLKRLPKREYLKDVVEMPNGDIRLVGVTSEVRDERRIRSDYYIDQEDVAKMIPEKGVPKKHLVSVSSHILLNIFLTMFQFSVKEFSKRIIPEKRLTGF